MLILSKVLVMCVYTKSITAGAVVLCLLLLLGPLVIFLNEPVLLFLSENKNIFGSVPVKYQC